MTAHPSRSHTKKSLLKYTVRPSLQGVKHPYPDWMPKPEYSSRNASKFSGYSSDMSGSEIFDVLVKKPSGFASKLATEQDTHHPPESSALMASKLQLPTVFCLSVTFGSVLMLAVAGCSSAESDPSDVAESPAEAESGKTDMDKMDEALAGFTEEERQSALKQHFCPVSGEMLGSMGVPEKVDVEGETVWICCNGCEDRLLADPDKYLAEL